MRRRVLLPVAAVVLVPVVVLGIEVQMARTAPRLDDEVGFRPEDLAVGAGADPLEVVWLGDSTSTGVGTARVADSMAFRVTRARDAPAELTILGVSGAQVHEVVDDQVPRLVDRVDAGHVPDVVYVSIGANDVTALTRRPTFEARYRTLVEQVQMVAPDAELVLVGIPDMGTAPRLPVPLRQLAGVRASQLDGVVEDVADARGVHHVDLAVRTSRTFSSDPDRYFADDGFHPSADGHGVWAEAVLASIDDGSR
jgi:acyl-CoA thioesterase I